MAIYVTSKNYTVETGRKLGGGGEGMVYFLRQSLNHVAKIYHSAHRTPEREQKLLVMIANPPKDNTRLLKPPHISIAWPVDILYEGKRFAGYVMPKIPACPEIFEVFNPVTRKKNYPDFNWRHAHRTAQNLAIALHALHARGYVMGDVNQKNVLVTPLALVTLVDTDSFQVNDPGGRVFRCPVGVPEYTPPELQGVSLGTVDRFKYHDNFGLAILIFQLLMNGYHPFTGAPMDTRFSTIGELYLHCMKQGVFPYLPNRGFLPPPNAPRFDALHPSLQELFIKAFVDGYKEPASRPEALKWMKALRIAEAGLVQCGQNPEHWYSKHSGKCHFCKESELKWGMKYRAVPAQKFDSGNKGTANLPQFSAEELVPPFSSYLLPLTFVVFFLSWFFIGLLKTLIPIPIIFLAPAIFALWRYFGSIENEAKCPRCGSLWAAEKLNEKLIGVFENGMFNYGRYKIHYKCKFCNNEWLLLKSKR